MTDLDHLDEVAVHGELEDQPAGAVEQDQLDRVRARSYLELKDIEPKNGDWLQKLLKKRRSRV